MSQTSAHAPAEKGGPLEKLLLALSLQNTYGDMPLCEREELFETRKQLSARYTKVNWPGVENLADYSWRDDDGNIYLQSIDDDLCTIILAKNCLHFRVTYWHLTGNKVGEWVQEMNLSTIKGPDDTAQPGLTDSIDRRDVPSDVNIGRLPGRVYKMMHEYVKVEQIHSIAQCPERWSYPVFCLLFNLAKITDIQNDLVIKPEPELLAKIEDNVVEIITGREYQTTLPAGDIDKAPAADRSMESQMFSERAEVMSMSSTSSAADKAMRELSEKTGLPIEDLVSSNP